MIGKPKAIVWRTQGPQKNIMPCQFPITNPEHVRESFSFFSGWALSTSRVSIFAGILCLFGEGTRKIAFTLKTTPTPKNVRLLMNAFFSLLYVLFLCSHSELWSERVAQQLQTLYLLFYYCTQRVFMYFGNIWINSSEIC